MPIRVAVLALALGCHAHIDHTVMPSDRPLAGAYDLGDRIDEEVCRRRLFGLIPLDPMLSPADQLEGLAGDGTLVRVVIELRHHNAIVIQRRCLRITAHRVGSEGGGSEADPAPDEPELAVAAEVRVDHLEGWPTIPFGTVLTSDHRVREVTGAVTHVDPNDDLETFLGMEVSMVDVRFVDGRAVGVGMRIPADALADLEQRWGASTAQGQRAVWQGDQIRVELRGRRLSIDQL